MASLNRCQNLIQHFPIVLRHSTEIMKLDENSTAGEFNPSVAGVKVWEGKSWRMLVQIQYVLPFVYSDCR